MGSYGVIKEALLVKKSDSSDKYSVVQRLVPSTVNGRVMFNQDGGFETNGRKVTVSSVYHGGAFGLSDGHESSNFFITVNIPGYGVKTFVGMTLIQIVNGVGEGVLCTPNDSDPSAPYTHLCLVVDTPGSVFVGSFG